MEPVQLNRLLSVCSFGDDNHIGHGVDQRDKTLANDRLIVNHHHANVFVLNHEDLISR